MGLPLYLEEGVPGRGLPLISAGSYEIFDGGGRDDSDEVRVGEYDLLGEDLLGIYGRYDGASAAVGRAMFGTLSSTDGDCGMGRDVVEEW